ncbi:AMP-binding protein [Alcaligenaceae bacterium CGII-47]|nr:AMP-binding protein [Alcaligenaceae bacterium CGII-47]
MSTISSKLHEQAQRNGATTAIVFDEATFTWSELRDLSLKTSSMLRERGVKQGDRVALLCGNRPAFLIAWFAIANIGAITVSINTGLVGDGLRYPIVQSEATTIVIEGALLRDKANDLGDLLTTRQVIGFDDEDELISIVAPFDADAVYDGKGSDPVSIIYTSGTTGRPKGVLNCHEAFLASGYWMVDRLAITADDRIMVFLPLFHTNPQMYAVMSALETGCTIILRPRFSVSKFFDEARRFQCTMFTYVGTVLSMLTSRLREPCHNHSITRCMGGGCPSGVWSIVQERFGIQPYELYGMTEIGGWVTSNSTKDYRFGSCGKARPDVAVRIVDDQDELVPPGSTGEIVVRPERPFVLLLGYWNDPKTTWESSQNLWFHTGDVGLMDEDGYLYFKGRLKEIIRRGGENISPFELEIALLDYPDIKDAAVVGVPDAIYGEEIKAVIVPKRPFAPASLVDFLKTRVAVYMIPRYVQFAQTIPRTETQKIQRHLLQQDNAGVIDLNREVSDA